MIVSIEYKHSESDTPLTVTRHAGSVIWTSLFRGVAHEFMPAKATSSCSVLVVGAS